jgi:HD-GYP domain-containing protein (c-di-GMP phosphodiesterase class II)
MPKCCPDALAYIEENCSKHFDPELVEVFHASLPEVMAIKEQHAEPTS